MAIGSTNLQYPTALDVFAEYSGLELLIALFMHLIPTFILIAVTVLAWKWEIVGAVLFPALGIFYIIVMWANADFVAYLLITGPVFLLGILFGLNLYYKQRS